MFFLKILSLVFLFSIVAGISYVAMTDLSVKQDVITKTIDNDSVLNDQ